MNTVWNIDVSLEGNDQLRIDMVVETPNSESFTNTTNFKLLIDTVPQPTELIEYIKSNVKADPSEFSDYITMALVDVDQLFLIRNNPFVDTYGDIEVNNFVVSNTGASADITIGGFDMTYYHNTNELVYKDDHLHNEDIKYNNEIDFKLDLLTNIRLFVRNNSAFIY